MLRRLLNPFLPERHVWITHLAAISAAAIVTLGAFAFYAPRMLSLARMRSNVQFHYLPAESICLTPYTADYKAPALLESRRPVLRLREYAPNRFELLYWGNPVRPHYAFSIMSLATGRTALIGTDGRAQRMLPLPVTEPRRSDGKLPLQPLVRLEQLTGREGDLYAARISVHDADKGTVLCSELYVICGSQPR
ncbi:MAG: hypothetical protein IKZ07_02775 [Akkermansia sp.]|nr:hypothetical protein [Akkermansia sp.]